MKALFSIREQRNQLMHSGSSRPAKDAIAASVSLGCTYRTQDGNKYPPIYYSQDKDCNSMTDQTQFTPETVADKVDELFAEFDAKTHGYLDIVVMGKFRAAKVRF